MTPIALQKAGDTVAEKDIFTAKKKNALALLIWN